MTSLDSIGSCSLDAYASSSEGTDPFSGTARHPTDQLKGHGKNQHKIGVHEDEDLASACTLCSVSALSSPSSPQSAAASKTANAASQSPEYVRRTARLFEGPNKKEEADFSNIPAAKKPSYLGLACSLSGYSGLTSYDSKLREGFRTRDRSPAPPPPRPLTSTSMSKQTLPTVNGIEKSSGSYAIQAVSPRSTHVNGTMSKDHGDGVGLSSTVELGPSTALRESSRQFMSTMLVDDTDFASSCTRTLQIVPPCDPSLQIKDSESETPNLPLKRSPGTVRIVEFTSQTKSYVSAVVSSTTSSRTLIQTSSMNERKQFGNASESTVNIANGTETQQTTPRSARSIGVISDSATSPGYTISKSFVQQRIERLYGPGALAQGFFSRTRQQSMSQEDSVSQSPEPILPLTSCTVNSALPVLRHLRPEFRAQLPLTSSNITRSPRHVPMDMPPNTLESQSSPPTLQQQTSVESISDSQPAAPEVPVLAVETMTLSNSIKTGDVLISPALCKEVTSAQESVRSMDKTTPNHTDQSFASRDNHQISQPSSEISVEIVGDEQKDGHYFLKVLRAEIQRLTKMVEATENELQVEPPLHEEAQGKLRAASGQARLLMKQKLQQFEGLCHKNISQSPDEVFPTTAQDLAGFWDMVKLQVDHVDRLFAEIDRLKSAGWVESTEMQSGSTSANANSTGARRRQSGRRSALNSSGGSRMKATSEDQKKGNDVARKSREDLAQARKRMMEERRRVLRQQQQAAKQESIEIFVPHENGK